MTIIIFVLLCLLFAFLSYLAEKCKVSYAVIGISAILMFLQFLALKGNQWTIKYAGNYTPGYIAFVFGLFAFSITAIIMLEIAILIKCSKNKEE